MSIENNSIPAAPTDRGSDVWGFPLEVAACPACKSTFVIPPGTQDPTCPVCFSAALSEQTDPRAGGAPELALPFTVDRGKSVNLLEGWLKGLWLRPADLSEHNLAQRIKAAYYPMWLVDGSVTGCWQAQAGYNYQVASSKEDYTGGRWTTQQVTETRIRWEPRTGTIQRSYNNLAIPALLTHTQLMGALGRFPIEQSVPFTPDLIKTVPVRLPDLSTEKAWSQARNQLDAAACQDCQAAAGAQHIDQCSISAEYTQLNWTLLLLPILSSFYRDDQGKIIPVWINGRTGQIFGIRKASQAAGWRWTGFGVAVGLACITVALVLSLLTAVFPPAVLLGGLLFITGIAILLASPVPAVWAWQYNRSHETGVRS